MIILVKRLTILVAATSMMLVGLRHREWRGGLLLLSCVFFASAMNEFEWLFQPLFSIDEPELPAIIFFLFEPESKMAIPLEAIWPWFRRMKLRREAKRYLKHIRETYGIDPS